LNSQPDYSAEQERLAMLNQLLNERCRKVIKVDPGDKILDVGSGLGIFSRHLARETGCRVIGIEKSPEQLETCFQMAKNEGEAELVEFREGSAYDIPLEKHEWGTFNIVHTRFLLEHLKYPQIAVDQMMLALRPVGKIVLIDDDHIHFQCYPPVPHFDLLWNSYLRAYDRLGNDPFIGRKLVYLLHQAGANNIKNDFINFGSTADDKDFEFFVSNVREIIVQTKAIIVGQGMVDKETFEQGIQALDHFKNEKGAAIWYSIHVAIGEK
jgi:SAM-dependent methyltransferase